MQIILRKNVFLFIFLTVNLYGQSETAPSIVLETSTDAICSSNPFFSLMPRFTDDGSFGSTRTFMYEYSNDGLTWTHFATSANYYTQRPANLWEGWYRVSVVKKEELNLPERRIIVSNPLYLQKIEGGCAPFNHPWPDEISEEVCPQGTLLFREDFGGNDPSDPVTSQTRLTTMSSKYLQIFDVAKTSPSSGRCIVAKHGWQNGLSLSKTDNMYSQWFIQDDHTYPNDYTRGYMLEVDGVGGNDAFYTTTFPVCHELYLSFSAYVANILEPGHTFAKPKVRFLIQDEITGDTIWEQSSGAIEPAPSGYIANGYPTVQSAPWHLVGASFYVPAGVSLIRLSIFNDENQSMGNDFAMDDIEIRMCKPEVKIEAESEICEHSPYAFHATVTTDGGFTYPYNYLWQYAKDSLPYNSTEWTNVHKGLDFSFDKVSLDDEGWYRLCVTSNGVDVETEHHCRAMSKPFHLHVKDCTPPCPELLTMAIDTTVCDTLMPFTWRDSLFTEQGAFSVLYHNVWGCDSLLCTYTLHIKHCCAPPKTISVDTTVCDTLIPYRWRDTLFTQPATYEIYYQDSWGCDSLICFLTLHTKHCCAPPKTISVDTTICDTLMPYRWRDTLFTQPATYELRYQDIWGCDSLICFLTLQTEVCCYDVQYASHDTVVCDTLMPFTWHGLVFDTPTEQELMEYSPRGCDSILHSYALDTIHCERLWPIIVNKYNWLLLCDNIALHTLFPDKTTKAFQWYKDEQPIDGAIKDDYSELNELHGRFQLRVTQEDGQVIWSNIIELSEIMDKQPVRVLIYDSKGTIVREDQLTHGIYFFRYEQGNRVWHEKKLIQ